MSNMTECKTELIIMKGYQQVIDLKNKNHPMKIQLVEAIFPPRKDNRSIVHLCSLQTTRRTIANNNNIWSIHAIMFHNSDSLLYQNNDISSFCDIAKDTERLYIYLGDKNGHALNTQNSHFSNDSLMFKIRLDYTV